MTYSVACQKREIQDPQLKLSFPCLVFYPTDTPAQPVSFGPFSMPLAMNAPLAAGHFPLVMLSHGSGGSYLTHRTLAIHLAEQGMVVAVPEHPHNNRHDNSWGDKLDNIQHRPRHLQLAMADLLEDAVLGLSLLVDQIGIIGHSVGAYTALALAGAQALVPSDEGEMQTIETSSAARIKGIVLLAPDLRGFVHEGAFQGVSAKTLLLVAEHDGDPDAVLNTLRNGMPQADCRLVANATHYSFLSPFPAALRSRVGMAGSDREGFDREQFHAELNAEVFAFLARSLRLD